MDNYIHIGKIAASFGLKGEVVVVHALGKPSLFPKGSVVFIEKLKGSYIPHFTESSKPKSDSETILKLEGLNTKESLFPLLQKKLWVNEELFQQLADKNAPIGLLNYKVFDNKTFLGNVTEVIEQPHQLLLVINYKAGQAYIPVHTETLKKIDRKTKEVHVQLPEGLLDVYES